jgi:hypothetical protein
VAFRHNDASFAVGERVEYCLAMSGVKEAMVSAFTSRVLQVHGCKLSWAIHFGDVRHASHFSPFIHAKVLLNEDVNVGTFHHLE